MGYEKTRLFQLPINQTVLPFCNISRQCAATLDAGYSSGSGAYSVAAAGIAGLLRRAGDGAIGTKDAAVAGEGFENGAAALAVVEPLAGVLRHGLGFGVAAAGAGEG